MKVFLADLVKDPSGHFHIMKALGNIDYASYADTKERKILVKRHPLSAFVERIRMFNRVLSAVNTSQYPNKIVHFLTADKFYFLPFLFRHKKGITYISTIHRFPSNRFLKILLIFFAKKNAKIVVLAPNLKTQFEKIGIRNVEYIPHCGFYEYQGHTKEQARKVLDIPSNKIVISLLGGTRFDKGMDIFLSALQKCSSESLAKLFINIAGREQDFTSDFILSNLPPDIACKTTLRNLSDEEFRDNVLVSDWVALPYRPSFNGVSGPMVEALSQGIPVIVPSDSSLSQFAEGFHGALEFDINNPVTTLADIIKEIANGAKLSPRNIAKLSVKNFINEHKSLYERISDKS